MPLPRRDPGEDRVVFPCTRVRARTYALIPPSASKGEGPAIPAVGQQAKPLRPEAGRLPRPGSDVSGRPDSISQRAARHRSRPLPWTRSRGRRPCAAPSGLDPPRRPRVGRLHRPSSRLSSPGGWALPSRVQGEKGEVCVGGAGGWSKVSGAVDLTKCPPSASAFRRNGLGYRVELKPAQPKPKVSLRALASAPRSPSRPGSHTYRCVRRRLAPALGSTLRRSAPRRSVPLPGGRRMVRPRPPPASPSSPGRSGTRPPPPPPARTRNRRAPRGGKEAPPPGRI